MSKIRVLEGTVQDEQIIYTALEIVEICAVESTVLEQMIEYGIVEPVLEKNQFSGYALKRAQKALRLRQDLAINWEGISLVLDLLEEIERLEKELAIHRGV